VQQLVWSYPGRNVLVVSHGEVRGFGWMGGVGRAHLLVGGEGVEVAYNIGVWFNH